MKQKTWYHGGLVFLGTPEGAIDRFSRIVAATLEDYGHPIDRQSILNDTQARIVTAHYVAKITLDPAPYSGRLVERAAGADPLPEDAVLQRAELSLCPISPLGEDSDISQLLLVVMLYRMVEAYPAHQIEWLDPDMILSLDQFLGTFAAVSPRRVRGRQQILSSKAGRFGPVEAMARDLSQQADTILGHEPEPQPPGPVALSEEEALALAFRYEPHPSELIPRATADAREGDLQRLASWGMTGMLVFLSAPVAVSMAAVNLIRGEDFRLNAQVLSLTACVVSMSSSGLLAEALAYLPI
ncbi:MAG: hypothetical protein AB7S99_16985 [Pseudodonghicola sp.]